MMPTFARPGDVTPGQFGPIRRAPASRTTGMTLSMSSAGMRSVMQTMSPIPASAASRIASGAEGAGT